MRINHNGIRYDFASEGHYAASPSEMPRCVRCGEAGPHDGNKHNNLRNYRILMGTKHGTFMKRPKDYGDVIHIHYFCLNASERFIWDCPFD